MTVIIYSAIQHLFIFRLFNDGAIPIKGHKETISLLKEGVYAHVTDQLTVKKVISDDFSTTGVCNFYLTARPLYSMSLGMIFPVTEVVYPLFNSSIPDLHTHMCLIAERQSLHRLGQRPVVLPARAGAALEASIVTEGYCRRPSSSGLQIIVLSLP